MEGWSEEEIKNKDLMAACGLYCGACGIYIATRDNNEKFRTILANLYGAKSEELYCLGCMQTEPAKMILESCRTCEMKQCLKAKGYYSCHQCEEWPCKMIDDFGYATGVRVMKKAIPIWRDKVAEFGDEKGSIEWARSECERYHCSSCGKPLFRGAQSCRNCKKDVADELDGSL